MQFNSSAIFVSLAVMLVTTTTAAISLATVDSVFARNSGYNRQASSQWTGNDGEGQTGTDNSGNSQTAGSQTLQCANEQFAVNTFCQASSAQNLGQNITNNQDQILEFTIGDVGGHVGVVPGTPPIEP